MTTLATFDILLRGDTRQFEQSMDRAQTKSSGFIKNMAGIASGFLVANVAMKGFSMGLDLVKDSLIGYNARMEQARIGFTTLLGSAEMAESFVAELQHFAAVTPFDFPGLQQASTTMMAMGFNAQEVIPVLTAVGDVVAAMGKSGGEASESINRIVYNLGQMKQYGRVTGRDIRDLTMLGVPVVKILAAGFKKSTTEIQNMIAKGLLPADKAIQVLMDGIESGNMGGMMEAQAKTFNGAMSTIKDTLQQLAGTALKPLFDAISKVTYAFSQWLQTPAAMEFANKIATAMRTLTIILERAAPAILNFAKGLAGLFKSSLNTAITLLQNVIGQIRLFSSNLAQGGYNAIVSFAKGMMYAAKTYVRQVVEYITAFISAYLIGMSPPKEGPLSQIDKGGKNTIDAWVKGAMSANLTPILDIPKKIANGLKSMEAMAKYIESNIQRIGNQLAVVDLNMARINIAANRLKWAYEDAIAPLQKQYDLLMKTYDLSDKRRDLELALKKNQLEQQLNAAKGDWWLQEQIQSQIDVVDQQIQANSLLEEQQNLQAQIAGLPLEEQMQGITDQYNAQMDPLERQLTLLERQRAELQFQEDVWRSIEQQVNQVVSALESAAQASGKVGGGGAGKGKGAGIGGGMPAPPNNIVPINEKLFADKEKVEKAAQAMADKFINAFGEHAKKSWPTILGTLIGGALGALSFTPFGVAIGASIGGLIGTIFSDQIITAFDNGIKFIQDMLSGGAGLDWGAIFNVENVVAQLGTFFQGIFDWIINVGVPQAAEALSTFALGFVDWVGNTLPLLLAELPKITGAVFTWIAQNYPTLLGKLGEWTLAFIGWVFSDLIPHLLPALGKVGIALLGALGQIAIQAGGAMLKMGIQMLSNLINALISLPGKVLDIFVRMHDNILSMGTKFADAAGKIAGNIGKAIVNTIKNVVNGIIRAINSFKINFDGIDLGPAGHIAAFHWGGFNIPYFHTGSWSVPDDMLANVQQGEMVLPKDYAEQFRQLFETGSVNKAEGGLYVNGPLVYIEHMTGSDADVNDLMDKMASALRLRQAG